VVVNHLLDVLENLGVAPMRLGCHAVDISAFGVVYTGGLRVDYKRYGKEGLDPFCKRKWLIGQISNTVN